jgi:hypothetical protein
MRVNVYAEEMTDRVEITTKRIGDHTFTGLRLYLELPASYHNNFEDGGPRVVPAKTTDKEQALQMQAPFMHHPGDDDSSAVTFWGKRDLRSVLRTMLDKLDRHYTDQAHQGNILAGPAPTEGSFRKKPVVIRAMQLTEANILGANGQWPDWLQEATDTGRVKPRGTDVVCITLEGNMTAQIGDWIICGVAGEIYPCKPEIFAATYDPA